MRNDLISGLGSLGCAARGLGNTTKAQQHLSEALRIANEIRAVGRLASVLPMLALLLADRGESERAVELYALASHCYPSVANSRWFEDVVGQHITVAAARLPTEVVVEAQERGRARDLWETVNELLVEMEG